MNHARQNRRRKARARAKLARWRHRRRYWNLQGAYADCWSSIAYSTLELRTMAAALTAIDPTARILNPIHDEITIVCAPEHGDAIAAAINRVGLDVPVEASADFRRDLAAYLAGIHADPHRLAAMELFKVPYSEVTDAMRQTAKAQTFAKTYGWSRERISEMIHAAVEADQ